MYRQNQEPVLIVVALSDEEHNATKQAMISEMLNNIEQLMDYYAPQERKEDAEMVSVKAK